MRAIGSIAREHGLQVTEVEGRSHTKVSVGSRQTVVPRHGEINEITARAILKQVTPPADGTEGGAQR